MKLLLLPPATFSLFIRKNVLNFLVALALIALAARSASADVDLNFIELPNDAGIHLTGTDAAGNPIDITKLGSQTFRVSAPGCTAIPGCNPDFTTGAVGTLTGPFLVNILDPGGPLSDQIYVHRIGEQGSQVIDFISDESGVPFFTPAPGDVVTTLVETGSLQPGLTYLNNVGAPVNVSFLSEVPEPATLPLLGVGIGAVLAMLRRKSYGSGNPD
jgi:hypothetical protein